MTINQVAELLGVPYAAAYYLCFKHRWLLRRGRNRRNTAAWTVDKAKVLQYIDAKLLAQRDVA